MPHHGRVLIIGHDKPEARRAINRHTGRLAFTPLSDVTAEDPTVPTPALLRDTDAAMHTRPFGAVVATSESTMLTAGFLRSHYGLPGPGYDASLVVTNKWRMRGVLAPAGACTPRAWLSGAYAELPEPPACDVVVKPLASQSARGVRRMTAAAARDWLRGRAELWLVEEAVDVVREYHCDGVLRAGLVDWSESSAYDRPTLQAHGSRTSTVLARTDPRRPELARAARAVAAQLPYPDGVFHMEFLDDGERLWFCEVGMRPVGAGIAGMLRMATGADLWAAFVDAQLGLDPGGHGPLRPVEDLTGLVLARPGPGRDSALHRDETARLPGVRGIGPGNLRRGQLPQDSCEFEYLAYFGGLTPDEAEALRDRVDGPVPAGRGRG